MCNLPSNDLLSQASPFFPVCATYAPFGKAVVGDLLTETKSTCGECCHQPYKVVNLLCAVLQKCVAETTVLETEVSFQTRNLTEHNRHVVLVCLNIATNGSDPCDPRGNSFCQNITSSCLDHALRKTYGFSFTSIISELLKLDVYYRLKNEK
jgi:hypothetical protein